MLYDVAIVGAGPAGSTAGYYLSKNGFKVAIVDKSNFPRDKPCGGGLPNHVIKRFNELISNDLIESHSHGGTTFSPSLKYKIKYTTKKPFTTMVLRRKFDYELLKKAIKEGSEFIPKKKVIDIKISKDKASLELADNTIIDSRVVIGADGIWSTVAKKTGLKAKNQKIGFSVVEEYEIDEETMDEYFGRDRLGYIHSKFKNLAGYGWVFPKKEHLNIGVGEVLYKPNKYKKNNLREVYLIYLSYLKKQRLIPSDIESERISGGALPVYPHKKTYSDRVLLIGDAAGFINPTSGEGIYYAMRSAEMASETIEKSLKIKDLSAKNLSNFQKKWKKDFGNELKLLYWISKFQRNAKKSEKNIKIICKEKKLKKLLIDVMTGNSNLDKNKWNILRSFIFASIKSKISKY